ncbi:MAG: hypothetical protein D6741_01300 [Planctomycetota bacterium]|nr:MAG: hypothetical protein D6741_01300 [Planctomycetota bacterium]
MFLGPSPERGICRELRRAAGDTVANVSRNDFLRRCSHFRGAGSGCLSAPDERGSRRDTLSAKKAVDPSRIDGGWFIVR